MAKRATNGELFPESLPRVIPALWPTVGTRAWDALLAIIEKPRNQYDYLQTHGCWRLGAYVQSLEYDGWEFNVQHIAMPGCRGLIAEHSLDRGAPRVKAALREYRKRKGAAK